MASFARLATTTASTKRSGGIVNGLEVGYTTNIASLKCLPLDPVDPELVQGEWGLAFYEVLQTTVEGSLDIVEGDVLVVATVEYPIRAVGDWDWHGVVFRRLILEKKK